MEILLKRERRWFSGFTCLTAQLALMSPIHRYISLDWSHGFKTKKLYNTLYIMNPGVVKVMAYISFCGGIL